VDELRVAEIDEVIDTELVVGVERYVSIDVSEVRAREMRKIGNLGGVGVCRIASP
jgi:hypothetical protein